MEPMNTENKKLFIFDWGNVIVENIYCNEAIAEELGISQAQVSRLEKNALKSMYDNMK